MSRYEKADAGRVMVAAQLAEPALSNAAVRSSPLRGRSVMGKQTTEVRPVSCVRSAIDQLSPACLRM